MWVILMVSHDAFFSYVEYNMTFVKQTKCTPIGTYYIRTLCKNRKKTLNYRKELGDWRTYMHTTKARFGQIG